MGRRFPGRLIRRPADVAVGSILVEGHNGVRVRVAEIVTSEHNWAYNELFLVPVDNPLPDPLGNAPGRRPFMLALSNILGFPEDMLEEDYQPSAAWLLLDDDTLTALPTGEYAERIGVTCDGIQWVPYAPHDLPYVRPLKSNHQCRLCRRWLEGEWSGADPLGRIQIMRQMDFGRCDDCTRRVATEHATEQAPGGQA